MGVALLPFIDADRLMAAERASGCMETLTPEEAERNSFGSTQMMAVSSEGISVESLPLSLGPGTGIAMHTQNALPYTTNHISRMYYTVLHGHSFPLHAGTAFVPELVRGTLGSLPGFDSVLGARGSRRDQHSQHKRSQQKSTRGGAVGVETAGKNGSGLGYADSGSVKKACKYFQMGVCTYAHNCKFSHDQLELFHQQPLQLGRFPQRAKSDPVGMCMFFQQGRCTKGSSCRFVHTAGPGDARTAVRGMSEGSSQQTIAHIVFRDPVL